MDLMDRVQNFLMKQHETLVNDLLDKYGIPPDEQGEYEEIVSRFLEETYGPAEKLAESIYEIKQLLKTSRNALLYDQSRRL
jgi:hypothetical protein